MLLSRSIINYFVRPQISSCASSASNRNLRRSIRSSHPEVFLGKGVLKICIKFTGEHPCRSEISIVAEQLYWNHTSAWVFSCKVAAYFENTFSNEKLWVVASDQWNWHKVKVVGKELIFVDKSNINESCLNNSKLYLDKKSSMLSSNSKKL